MPEPPRLVQIAEFDRPQGGSFVPMLSGVLELASAWGWRTTAVLPETAERAEWIADIRAVAEVELAPASALGSRRTRGEWLARTLHEGRAPTILHTHFTSWDVAALIASRHIDAEPAAVFWHVHSALPRDAAVVARSAVKFGVLGRGVAGILCPAPNIVLGVAQRLGPEARIHFVPSALDPSLYPLADAAARESARRELDLPADAKVVLHFGWHPYLKGTDIFLGVLRDLIAEDDSVVGIVRGHEPESVTMAADLGIADNVRFQDPVPDAASLFAAADVVVSSSREEGMAYTVLEALCSGTPVVATAIPGHAYIGEQVEACRITSIDPRGILAATRETLALPPERRAEIGAAAHEWIVENLSVPVIAERMISLYERELPDPTVVREATPSARSAARSRSQPTVIAVAEFANEAPGSFVPMLAAGARATTERGWRAEVVLPAAAADRPWAAALAESGARVRFAPEVGRDGTRRWLRGLIAETSGPSILHTHFTGFDLAASFATRGVDEAASIWHVHSTLSRTPWIVVRNFLKFGLAGRGVDAIICPAPELVGALTERGAPRDRVRFVPNAIDLDRFTPFGEGERRAARDRLGIEGDGIVVLGFSWSWEVKGGELFVRAVDAARRETPVARAMIVTADPRAPRLIAELGLDGIAEAIAPAADPRSLYAATDVFVAASRAEGGTPFAVLETLASGVPVVASELPAHRYIADRASGVTLVPREPVAFGAAIAAAAEQPGTPAVDATFGLDRWCGDMIEVYEAALLRLAA